jgi:hypothetical protein
MKKLTLFLLLFTLSVLNYSCGEDEEFTQEFQLFGDEAEIPSLYFWKDNSSEPVISGTAKGTYVIELTTDADISGIFHLGYFEVGRFYKKDIIRKEFKLKKGETFKDSGSFSFYGEIFDSASILVDIKTAASSNPARIVRSSVSITK